MASMTCRNCGREVETLPKCSHCGAARKSFPRQILKWTFVGLSSALAAIVMVAVLAPSPSPPATATQAAPPIEAAPASRLTPATTPAPEASREPTREEVVQAYSDSVGKQQGMFFAWALFAQMQNGRIMQDVRFLNQDRMESDAEVLMQRARQLQADVYNVATPVDIPEDAATQFEAVQAAASDLAMEIVSLAADMAVFAHTGLTNESEVQKDGAALTKARRRFEAAVYEGYKALGVPRSKINPSTLTLKP